MVALLPHPPPTRRNRAVDSPNARRDVKLSCRRLRTAGPGERPTGPLSTHVCVFAVFAAFAALILPIAARAAGPPAPNNGGVLAPKPVVAPPPTARRAPSSVLRPPSFVRAPRPTRPGAQARRPAALFAPAASRPAPRTFSSVRAPRPGSITLLDGAGHLRRPVTIGERTGWISALHQGKFHGERAAKLYVWLGEYALAHNQDPERASWYFTKARGLTGHRSPEYGRATYDKAFCLLDEGAYEDAAAAFHRLLAGVHPLRGYDPRDCVMVYRHANACWGYHLSHEKLGIPEPPRLDPFCGAASLAVCMRGLGMPWQRPWIISRVKVTGEGSTMLDILDAGPRLGVHVRAVAADDTGLRALPKPCVAYVEADHLVAVTRADATGITFICSDCGPWPGGKVRLTWNQWHTMSPGLFAVVTRIGSRQDHWLSAVLSPKPKTLQVAGLGNMAGLAPSLSAIAALKLHILAVTGGGGGGCGSKYTSTHCKCGVSCPIESGDGPSGTAGTGQGAAPSPTPTPQGTQDPVNLATGEEEYTPAADLTVYNPNGPAVIWRRSYGSLRNDGWYFGQGWSFPYNVGMAGGAYYYSPNEVLAENGSLVQFTQPSQPTAQTPRVACAVENGVPMMVEADYDPVSTGTYYTVTFANRTKWITVPYADGIESPGALSQIVDKSGNAIHFQYGAYGLASISDSAGHTLLTINWNPDMTVASVSDCYGRSVYYQYSSFNGYWANEQMLSHVSQIVPTGTLNPPDRYAYTYVGVGNSEGEIYPSLHTITVPSPTGVGNSTATIDYTTDGLVADTVDANGNQRAFDYAGPLQTIVTAKDSSGAVVYTHTASFDNYMSATADTDAAGTTVWSKVYSDPNDPYAPSSVTDGVGTALNPEVPQASAGSFNSTGADAPAAGTWDIVLNGGTVASSTAPNGWSVSLNTNSGIANFTVDAPAGATIATDYEVRLGVEQSYYGYYYYYYYYSGRFDVVAPGTIRKGTTSYTWDQYGNMLTMTSPRGTVATNTYSYANFGQGELTQTQTGNKSPTTFTYFEPSGLRESFSRPLPGSVGGNQFVTTAFTYNALGNVLTLTTPGNNSAASILTTDNYTTDGTYNQAAAADEPLTETDNLGKVFHFRYGPRGNLTEVIDPLGNETDYNFNLADQLTTVTYPATGETGTGRASAVYAYLYPGGPLTSVTNFDESGVQVRQRTMSYGAEGELLAKGGSTEPVSYTYDGDYRVATLSDGDSHQTSFSYNANGYLSSITYPGGDSVQFPNYNSDGAALKRIDGNSVETDFVYNDPESRLTNIQYPATPALNVGISYDGYGRRAGMLDSTGAVVCGYDDNDLPLSVQTTYTGLPAETISYGYYPDASRASMGTPAGTFSYGYDAEGLPSSLTNPYSETSSWSYLDNRWLASQQLGNGAITYYTYNARGFPIRLQNETSGSVLLSDFGGASGMVYDSVGNRTSMAVNIPGSSAGTGANSYSYNGSDELTQEQSTRNGGYTEGFGYDAAFNPTTFKGGAHTFNLDNHDNAISYDGNGSPTSYNGNATTFDPENRMTAYGSLMTAGYNGDGPRAWKQTAAGRTYFLYDGSDLICELDSSGAVTAVNTIGATGLLSRHTASGSTFYTFDTQGNVVQRLAANQSVISTDVYDAFGGPLSGSSSDPFGFGGQYGYYSDHETGLQLLSYRYYSPAAGRFLTRDPKGYPGGLNLYAYADNDTPNATDPAGLDVWRIVCGGFDPGHGHWVMWPYSHVFLRITRNCPFCEAGFYGGSVPFFSHGQVSTGSAGDNGWNINDPRSNCRGWIQSSDPDFDADVCRCVQYSQAHPPVYTFGYVCGDWVTTMLQCASSKWNGSHPNPFGGF